MANNIATITRFLPKVIDQVFVNESKTEILEQGSKYIDLNFKEAGYVKVYSLLMDGLSDYYRANSVGDSTGSWLNGTSRADAATHSAYAPEYDHSNPSRDGFARGSVDGNWEIFKLRYYRGKQFRVDQMDDEETAGLIIGNLLTEFLRTKVVPEVDIVRFDVLGHATNASIGNRVYESIDYSSLIQANGLSSESMIAKFNRAFVWLNAHEVPDEDQVIFVSNDVWGLLLGDPLLTRFIDVEKVRNGNGVDLEVKTYMGRPVIQVPKSRFYSDPVLGENGYAAGASSHEFNYLVCSKRAIVPVVKLDYAKIFNPEVVQDYIGYKINFAIYHDAFVPKNKKLGVYASMKPATAVSNALYVATTDITSASTNFKVTDWVTTPAGILGSLVYAQGSSNPFSVGTASGLSGATDYTGADITIPTTNGYKTFFALEQYGVSVAVGELNLITDAKSATYTITTPTTPVSVSSSNTAACTVAFSGTTTTVTKVAAGTSIVDIVYADGTIERHYVKLT